MCMKCPQKGKCAYAQAWEDCAKCQYAVKNEKGKVTGCACPPSKGAS